MKNNINMPVLHVLFVLVILCSFSAEAKEDKFFKKCAISISSLSKTTGKPGDVIKLYGNWGKAQGEKIPRINRGRANDLEVLSWSSSVIKARIPESLEPGSYKVGVYCNDPYDMRKGGSYSSGWLDFEISNSNGK